MKHTNIKPVNWFEEKARLAIYYHRGSLIALLLFFLILAGVVYWFLGNPPYTELRRTCNGAEIQISYPRWVLPNTEYQVNWIVSGNASIKIKSDTPLIILKRSEHNATFQAKRVLQWSYSVLIHVLVLSDTSECSTIQLEIMVMSWYPVLRGILQILTVGSFIVTLILGVWQIFDRLK